LNIVIFLFKAIEEAAAAYLLPSLLKEKGGTAENFIKICTVC
jgi:hypothetical protein